MQLISMKQDTEDEYKAEGIDDSPYPYGLQISVDDGSLQKLGIGAMPPVGTTMQLVALVNVIRTSEYQSEEGKDACLTLQITDMKLSAPAATNTGSSTADIAKALYG